MYVSQGNPSPQHNSIRRCRYGFRGMHASDNQSPVMWENRCRATRLRHGKGGRVVRCHRIACCLVAMSVALERTAPVIGETFDGRGFIEDSLQIAPATKNIAIVIGASAVEQYWAAAFRKEFEPFTNRINFIWLNDLSLDQMLEKTRALPPDSYIFLILLLRDATGVTHNADEALQRIHAVANAPINGIFQHQLGLGIVGGRLYQAELEGIESV